MIAIGQQRSATATPPPPTVGGGTVLTEEFSHALDILEQGGNLYLTGKAGTGKSTLIRHFLEHADRRVVVAAPTGIAALNVEGYTIHRLFSFRTTTMLADVQSGDYYPRSFAGTLRRLDTLIIDEASMVRADIFDMLVTALERFGPKPGQRYGGVQLVLVGDLFQLPPVVGTGEEEYFATRYPTPYFFSADHFARADFPTVALTTVFRQQGDQRLTGLLNAVREGVLVEDSRRELNTRTDPDFVPPDDEFWLTLARPPTAWSVPGTAGTWSDFRVTSSSTTPPSEATSACSTRPSSGCCRSRWARRSLCLPTTPLTVGSTAPWAASSGWRTARTGRRWPSSSATVPRRWSARTRGRPPGQWSTAGRCGTRWWARTGSSRSSSPGPSPSTRARGRRWTGSSSTSAAALSTTARCTSR